MKLSVGEIARAAGVSVRTIQYYDSIGLLKPVETNQQNGYRYYDESSVNQLKEILYYKGLDFPLKEIP
ncbi:MAG: MerR family transcriptional regulator, partial [Oscillospiraceae bacterium]|nr:MerR family transcriptional regulator [Oscillospiraceae bacterium]